MTFFQSPFGPDLSKPSIAGGRPRKQSSQGDDLFAALQHLDRQQRAQGASGGGAHPGARRMRQALIYWGEGVPFQRLVAVAREVLWRQAYLIDPAFLCERSAGILAREWVLTGRSDLTERHLRDCVLQAIGDVLSEEETRLFDGVEGDCPQRRFDFLVHHFGVPQAGAWSAAARYNQLSRWARCAFQALVIEGKTVEECLAAGMGPEARLRKEVRRGLKALLCIEDLWPDVHASLGTLGAHNPIFGPNGKGTEQ